MCPPSTCVPSVKSWVQAMIGNRELTEQELELTAKYLCISLEELKALKPEMYIHAESIEYDTKSTRLILRGEVLLDAR